MEIIEKDLLRSCSTNSPHRRHY